MKKSGLSTIVGRKITIIYIIGAIGLILYSFLFCTGPVEGGNLRYSVCMAYG